MISQPKPNKGFSLLESLITATVLSVAFLFIFRSFMNAVYLNQLSQDTYLALGLAKDTFWEIEQVYSNNLQFSDGEKHKIQKKDFNLNYNLIDTDDNNLKNLKLTVSWKSARMGGMHSLDFAGYLLKR